MRLFGAGIRLWWGAGTLNWQPMSLVYNLLSSDDESARSDTSLGWLVCKNVDWQHVHVAVDEYYELGRLTREKPRNPLSWICPLGEESWWRLLDANRGGGGTPASGLRASHNRRGLQTVQPSVRRGRGELRARTPQYFRADPAMSCDHTFVYVV